MTLLRRGFEGETVGFYVAAKKPERMNTTTVNSARVRFMYIYIYIYRTD
jgi:hypothetical protein